MTFLAPAGMAGSGCPQVRLPTARIPSNHDDRMRVGQEADPAMRAGALTLFPDAFDRN